MKTLITLSAFCAALITSPLTLAHAPQQSSASHAMLSAVLKNITPAVVNIAVEKKIPTDNMLNDSIGPGYKTKPKYLAAVGSGVIFNAKEGLIVTNAHVADDSKLMIVTLKDGRRYHGKVVAKDDGFDIAIVKINAKHLKQIQFGNSSALKVGNSVAAIGSPFGLTQSVTSGVVSALNRATPQIEGFQNFIQTDAPINPGNSGGALVNMRGQLVGINTAIVSASYGSSGIGFAIPSNMVKSVLMQLLKYGKVKRGALGVIVQNITPNLGDALHIKPEHGTIVTEVVPNSAAQKAGVKPQDIITAVNSTPINTSNELRDDLAVFRPETKVTLSVIRGGQPIQLVASLGNPKKLKASTPVPFLSGMNLRNFSELESNGKTLNGILVSNISQSSAGALAGLAKGDVITAANGKTITSVSALKAIAMSNTKQLLLTISRQGWNLFIVIEPGQ